MLGSFGHPRGQAVLPLIVSQLANAGAVAAHHKQLTIRLRNSVAQWCFVLVSLPRAAEKDPLAVPGLGAVGIVSVRIRQAPHVRAVRLDSVNIEIAVAIAGEGDAVPARRPGREVVVLWTCCERSDLAILQ